MKLLRKTLRRVLQRACRKQCSTTRGTLELPTTRFPTRQAAKGQEGRQGKAKAAADQSLPLPFARIRFRCFPGQKPGPGFGAAVSYSAVLVTALPAAAMDSSALPNSWNWNRSHRFDAPQHHQERGHQILFALGDYPI